MLDGGVCFVLQHIYYLELGIVKKDISPLFNNYCLQESHITCFLYRKLQLSDVSL